MPISKDAIIEMSEGNKEVLSVIRELLEKDNAARKMNFLHSVDIIGSRLWTLYDDCSARNIHKLDRTITLLMERVYSLRDLSENLSLESAVPFVDEKLDPVGTPAYDKKFTIEHQLWEDYVYVQKAAFKTRLKEAKEYHEQHKNSR